MEIGPQSVKNGPKSDKICLLLACSLRGVYGVFDDFGPTKKFSKNSQNDGIYRENPKIKSQKPVKSEFGEGYLQISEIKTLIKIEN